MPPRPVCLTMANTFTLLRLLPRSEPDEDLEIRALRHHLPVLHRRAGRPRFTETDRASLSGIADRGQLGRCL